MYQIFFDGEPVGASGLYGDMVGSMDKIRKTFAKVARVESIGKPHWSHVKVHGVGTFKIEKTGVDIMALVTSGRS